MAVAAIVMLSSCSKEEDNNASLKDSGAFYATIEDGSTRTTLGTGDNANKVLWSSDDKISINGTEYTLSTGEGTTQATFTGETVSGETFNAYYPASIYNGGTLTLPATQTYDATTNGISNLPMYAESNDHNLVFKNLCAVLAITVKNTDVNNISTLKSIRVSSSNHDMSGAFTVSDSKAVLSNDQSGVGKVVLASTNTLTLTSEGTTFYISIPAQSYEMLKIELSSDGEKYPSSMTTQAISGITVERNKIYSINYADNKLTAKRGFSDANINSQMRPVKWAQLWANGPRWATINVGATISDYAGATGYTTANVGGLYRWCATVPNNMLENTSASDDHCTGNYSSDNDTAKKLWGDNWRMPTGDELTALKDGLDNGPGTGKTLGLVWTWCDGSNTQYVSGCTLLGAKVTGKDAYSSISIFLPAAGYFNSDNSNITDAGKGGNYWSSAANYSNATALFLMSYSTNVDKGVGYHLCSFGRSVRAVLAESEFASPSNDDGSESYNTSDDISSSFLP